MLRDAREYAKDYPRTNPLINAACTATKDGSYSILENEFVNALTKENDALINVALTMAPDFACAQLIWQYLHKTINQTATSIFAIPIVFVVGSSLHSELKFTDFTEDLNQLLVRHQVFVESDDAFVSAKLISLDNLGKITPSQMYYWARNIDCAQLWLPLKLDSTNITFKQSGVFVRFLLGVSVNSKPNLNNFNLAKMELMHLITKNMSDDNVTTFVIPFDPVPLSLAGIIGQEKRTEIAISVALSDAIREIRKQRLTPKVTLAAINSGIKLVITCEDGKISEELLWPLQPFEDFAEVLKILGDLVHDLDAELDYD